MAAPSPHSLGRLVILAALVCAPGLLVGAAQRGGGFSHEVVSRVDGQRMRAKVVAIEERASLLERVRTAAAATATVVSEREVNSYLVYEAGAQMPVGLAEPRIGILGDGRLVGTALVDLDAVKAHRKASGWLDPFSYLSGRMPVAVSGRLSTGGGLARFDLESARISGIPIPKTLIQEIVAFYSRTPTTPHGVSLDDTFVLPARIRRIDVRRGEAVVFQQ